MEDLTTFEVPSRFIKMVNGEHWEFRFDNRALFSLDRDYSGAPESSLQMLHALTATYQHKSGLKVGFEEFLDLLPPVQKLPQIQSLMAEIAGVNKKTAAGNEEAVESQSPPQLAGNDATTIAE